MIIEIGPYEVKINDYIIEYFEEYKEINLPFLEEKRYRYLGRKIKEPLIHNESDFKAFFEASKKFNRYELFPSQPYDERAKRELGIK